MLPSEIADLREDEALDENRPPDVARYYALLAALDAVYLKGSAALNRAWEEGRLSAFGDLSSGRVQVIPAENRLVIRDPTPNPYPALETHPHPMSNPTNHEPSVLRMRDVVRGRYRAGETAHALAIDYGCTTSDIRYALAEKEVNHADG